MLCCGGQVVDPLLWYISTRGWNVAASVCSSSWRTSRAWELLIPSSASSSEPPPSVHPHPPPPPPPPPVSRTPRVSRARTRAKLRGNGCWCDRGGWAARSERWAAWVVMSAMLAMAYWTGEEQRSLGEKKTDRERARPGPARLCSRCYGPELSLNRPADSQRPSQIHPWELEADLLLFIADRLDLCCIFYYKNE